MWKITAQHRPGLMVAVSALRRNQPARKKNSPAGGRGEGLILMLIARFLARGRPGFQWTVARNVPVGWELFCCVEGLSRPFLTVGDHAHSSDCPACQSVPPKLYGGTERVVSWLTEELVSLGHEVTLFATGDFVTSAQLVPVARRALRLSRPPPDPAIATAALLEAVADAAPKFDVIHSHLDWVHLPLLRCLRVPFLTTLHGRLDLPNIELMGQRFPNAPFVSISQSQRSPAPDLNWLATIHHGLP